MNEFEYSFISLLRIPITTAILGHKLFCRVPIPTAQGTQGKIDPRQFRMVSLLWCFVLAVLHCGKNDVMGQPQNVGESVGSTMALAPGIFPHLTATADSAPKRSESGTGAMMVGAQITSSQIP